MSKKIRMNSQVLHVIEHTDRGHHQGYKRKFLVDLKVSVEHGQGGSVN